MVSVVLVMSALFRVATSAQKAPEKSALEVKDTKQFFDWFKNIRPAKRTEFETEQDYKKRLPPPFNSKKVIYFRANCRKGYAYDISSEKLTVFGGSGTYIWPLGPEYKGGYLTGDGLREGTAVVMESTGSNLGSYTAANVYGALFVVKSQIRFEYILNFLNRDMGGCPDEYFGSADKRFSVTTTYIAQTAPARSVKYFDSADKRFSVTVEVPPKEAERLSKTLEIVVGVTLPGYDHSLFNCYNLGDSSEPTIRNPIDCTTVHHAIDANLVKVLLRDSASGRVLLERDVPQN